VLVGALCHSSKFGAWITDADGQARLIAGIDQVLRRLGGSTRVWRKSRGGAGRGPAWVLRRLGGSTRVWRVDRMATVINPPDRQGPVLVRAGGEALRGEGGSLSSPAGQPQRGGGKGHLPTQR
jgi:hypothetical protein